jgi:hypothetical protein
VSNGLRSRIGNSRTHLSSSKACHGLTFQYPFGLSALPFLIGHRRARRRPSAPTSARRACGRHCHVNALRDFLTVIYRILFGKAIRSVRNGYCPDWTAGIFQPPPLFANGRIQPRRWLIRLGARNALAQPDTCPIRTCGFDLYLRLRLTQLFYCDRITHANVRPRNSSLLQRSKRAQCRIEKGSESW